MRTRGNHQPGTTAGRAAGRAGAVAVAGLAMLAIGSGPVHAADEPAPGKGSPSKPATEVEPKPVQDVTPPQRPTLGEASVAAGGAVELDVLAEGGSALVVREGARVVASASAVGEVQTLSWRTGTGPHTFLVVATDAAGNVSDSAPVTLDVDATPPAAKDFAVQSGTDRDSRSRWSVTTERGTAYRLVVDGETVVEGTIEGRSANGYLTLSDGRHDVALELRDELGNLRTLTDTVDVTIPELWVAAKDVSANNSTERSFKIAAAPGTRGFLRIPGGATAKFELPEGRAEVTLEVEEGEYKAPVITVADTLDRKGQVELAPFEVDNTAPAVQVEAVSGAGARGMLAAMITAGAGETVTWRLVDEKGIPAMSGEFVADGTAQLLERPVSGGSYELEVTATDANGNTTVETMPTAVEGRSLVNPDMVPALVGALVVWLLLGLVVLRRRRSRRLAADAGDKAATRSVTGRAHWTKRRRLLAEHAQAVTEYQERLAVFQAEERVWEERRAALAQLQAVAEGGRVEAPGRVTAVVPVLSSERVLCVLPATLVEMGDQDGVEVEVEAGQLVVSSGRFAFVGDQHREWELGTVEQLRHLGQDRTLLKVSGEDSLSGVRYDDADLVRLYLELAMAEHQGDSRSVRMMVEQGVRSHELRRPLEPTAVGAAPVAGKHGRRAKGRSVPQTVGAGVPAAAGPAVAAQDIETVGQDASTAAKGAVVVAQQGEPVDEQISRELVLQR